MQRNRRFALDLRYSQLAANASIARQAAMICFNSEVLLLSEVEIPSAYEDFVDSCLSDDFVIKLLTFKLKRFWFTTLDDFP